MTSEEKEPFVYIRQKQMIVYYIVCICSDHDDNL